MRVLSAFLLVVVSGCATQNFVATSYDDYTKQFDPQKIAERLEPPSGHPKIVPQRDALGDDLRIWEEGFCPIGQSNFEASSPPTEKQMLGQAIKIGADIVTYFSMYSRTEARVMPMFQYQPGSVSSTTSTGSLSVDSSGSATANWYGYGGYGFGTATATGHGTGTYYGTTTTETPGTFTTDYVPYNVRLSMYLVGFWRKAKPAILGVQVNPLTDEIRQKLQRNTGVLVVAVRRDAPAFRANILKNDIILRLADTEIVSVPDFFELVGKNKGQTISICLLRNGEEKVIDVSLENGYSP